MTLPKVQKLFELEAFDYEKSDEAFLEAMRESYSWHYQRSREFRGMSEIAHFDASDLKTLSDIEDIPWIFVQNFKEHALKSVADDDVRFTFTSSGTGGTKTQLFLDQESYDRLILGARRVLGALGSLQHTAPCNYLMFTYDIAQAEHLGTAWTDVMISEMVPGVEKVFLIRDEGQGFQFNLELALREYERLVKTGRALRLLGFPAFMSELFREIKIRGLPKLTHAHESWILTGGGWKNHRGEVISKSEFAEFAHECTGLPAQNVRDMFGMTEHGVAYFDCEAGQFHIPVYARVVIRDPWTLKKMPSGQSGLMQLVSPILTSYPSISLLTTDEARVLTEPCVCGRAGPRLEYVGRLGLKQYEGCALRALEYLKT
jgi:phenylacetate-coenzyme A ligase PaaK-like adenylate-forming protein